MRPKLTPLILAAALHAWPADPNVVLIISDDHGWPDYGFMGNAQVRTPHIDRLAREGLTLTRGYVPSSLCRPSLASIMTGLYPHQHRITGNDPPGEARNANSRASMVRVFQESKTLAGLLTARGYMSLQTGKWWEGECKCGGFTECMTHGDVARGGRHGDQGLDIGRKTMQPVFSFIDRAASGKKPFFLWYAPMMPHTPHNPPDRLLSKYTGLDFGIAKYYAMIEWFDETIGQLMDHLSKAGVADNTLVVYMADNGWVQVPGGVVPSRAKLSPYDAGLRTPLIFWHPKRIRPARDSDALASTVDVAATVLPFAGLKPLAGMPGINVLDAKARSRREAVFGAIFAHSSADIEKPEANVKYRWVVRGRHKLVIPHTANASLALWPGSGSVPWMRGQTELFDILADPGEQSDLSASQPALAKELAALVNRWWPVAENRQ